MPVTTELSPNKPHPELVLDQAAAQQKPSPWRFLKRAFPVALTIFAAANIAFSGVLAPKSIKDDEKNAKGGDFWTNPALIDLAVHQYQAANQAERQRVVLLGSSLVMFPFWSVDAGIDPKIADIAHYHQSMALSQRLTLPGEKAVSVFNLASAGQMASDTYLYVNEFLSGPNKPDVLFWGVAPRDFGDANLTNPMATVSFKRIVNLQNLEKYKATFLPHFNEQAEFIANEVCWFYGRRWRMQRESDRLVEKVDDVVTRTLGVTPGASTAAAVPAGIAAVPAGIASEQSLMPAAEEPGANVTRRLTGVARERWVSSIKEYRSRYKGIGDRDITVQMDCLERVLKLCDERGIKVVLANLPLTKANRDLMPDGFYNRFGNQLAAAARKHGDNVRYFDLSADKTFTDYDFWDTVHMNQIGGLKMMSIVQPAMQADLGKK